MGDTVTGRFYYEFPIADTQSAVQFIGMAVDLETLKAWVI